MAKVSLIFRDTFLHGTEGVRREYGTMISQNSQRYLITNIWQNKLVFFVSAVIAKQHKTFFCFFDYQQREMTRKKCQMRRLITEYSFFRKQKSLNKWTAFSGKNEV